MAGGDGGGVTGARSWRRRCSGDGDGEEGGCPCRARRLDAGGGDEDGGDPPEATLGVEEGDRPAERKTRLRRGGREGGAEISGDG